MRKTCQRRKKEPPAKKYSEELIRTTEYTRDNFLPKPIIKREPITDIKIGTNVNHAQFGVGMIVMIEDIENNNDKKIKISFEGKGIKTLLLSIAPITKI